MTTEWMGTRRGAEEEGLNGGRRQMVAQVSCLNLTLALTAK